MIPSDTIWRRILGGKDTYREHNTKIYIAKIFIISLSNRRVCSILEDQIN